MPSEILVEKIDKEIVLALLGGKWPADFSWNSLEHFRILGPGMLQGYVGEDPVGPALKFTLVSTDPYGQPLLHFGPLKHKQGTPGDERVRTVFFNGRAVGEFTSRVGISPEECSEFLPNASGQAIRLNRLRHHTIMQCISYIGRTMLGLSEADCLATLDALGEIPFHESAK